MFFPSSTNNYNINPFSHLPAPPPSSYHLPLSSHQPNGNGFLNHHHNDLVSASSLFPSAANPQQLNLNETLLNMELFKKDGDYGVVGFGGGGPPPGLVSPSEGSEERPTQQDLHCARVEWLLRNSRNAISEVAKMKQCGNVGCAGTGPTSLLSPISGDDDPGRRFKQETDEEVRELAASPLKESRTKARARARARTREKMNISTTRTHEWKTCPDSSPHPLRSFTELEPYKKPDHLAHGHKAHNNNHPSMASSSFEVVAHQVEQPSAQNLATSKDANCNSSPNLSQNWDINGPMAHSTLCAITNVNLSTGAQLYGKP
ncbi:hypothetical protein F3Y22_tig00111088pilonHSYRG00196 [Hibiscus syriacus]|uniref:R domain-containing protein n=1 Tax=Hibiscus syriacus TaxID=106335 RepID=A0A6A2Z3G5_HIBSY|nr:hypothetical protein F3Y22_tig00111088pilonHSYRG00196 [Hibiscus syriacus]